MAALPAPLTDQPVPDVYRGICQVALAISREGVAKGGKNAQQGYKFRGIDDICNALSPLIAGAELCILPRMISRSQAERATIKGGVLFYVVVQADFDFVSSRDGSKHTVTMFGEAMDSADKATNKAMSAALKYCLMQVFCIPTEGARDDADAVTHQPAPRIAAVPTRPQPAAAMAEQIPEPHEEQPYYEDAPDQPTLEEQLEYSLNAEKQKLLDAFSAIKSRYISIGFGKTYVGRLALHGVQHPSQFADTQEGWEQARECYRQMKVDVTAREERR